MASFGPCNWMGMTVRSSGKRIKENNKSTHTITAEKERQLIKLSKMREFQGSTSMYFLNKSELNKA